jgi:hypothetical protein
MGCWYTKIVYMLGLEKDKSSIRMTFFSINDIENSTELNIFSGDEPKINGKIKFFSPCPSPILDKFKD